jgi:hypothetical protein
LQPTGSDSWQTNLARHSSGEKRLGRHVNVVEVSFANALRGGLVIELWVQPEEPCADGIDRATSRIKTTARIDTITLGRD